MKIIHSAVYKKWGDPAASMIHPLLIQIQSRGNAGFCKTTGWQELSCQLLFGIIISWQTGKMIIFFHLLQIPSTLLSLHKGLSISFTPFTAILRLWTAGELFCYCFQCMSLIFFFFSQSIPCPMVKYSWSTQLLSWCKSAELHRSWDNHWIYTSWESGPQIPRQANNSQWIIYSVSFTWFSAYENLWFILHSMQSCSRVFPLAKNPLDCRSLSVQVMGVLFRVACCEFG